MTREDLAGFDAVVDAFGAWTEETLPMHSTSLAHLSDVLSGSDIRLLVDVYKRQGQHTGRHSGGPDS